MRSWIRGTTLIAKGIPKPSPAGTEKEAGIGLSTIGNIKTIAVEGTANTTNTHSNGDRDQSYKLGDVTF